tara:strand:- start:385 stop:681 length:297 start_codon:yes stop_codon:yes gene_type:complete
MEYENSARSFKSFILLICYIGLILTLKYLIAVHNFFIIFLVLIVLPLAFEIRGNKKLASKYQIKKSLGFQESLKANYIYQIFPVLNSKKGWIYLTEQG